MTDYVLVDLVRVLVIAGSLWLAALVLRLGWGRRAAQGSAERPSLFTYASFAVALLLIGIRRVEAFGGPADWHLIAEAFVVVLGLLGVARRIRFTAQPPWRRPQR